MLVVPTGGTFCPNAWDIAYSIFLHCLYVPQRNHICRKTHFVFVSIKFFGVFLVLTEDAAELFSNPHFRITNANTHCRRIKSDGTSTKVNIPPVGIFPCHLTINIPLISSIFTKSSAFPSYFDQY